MSNKPCPQCGATVPAQARFCGQCGRTFGVEPGARAVPITVDEATADPPPAQPAARRPIGMATVFGHPGVALDGAASPAPAVSPAPGGSPAPDGSPAPGGSPALAVSPAPGASPVASPAPVPSPGLGLGRIAAPSPALAAPPAPPHAGPAIAPAALSPLGKTMFDPSPYGAAQAGGPESATTSQRPTPIVPPPAESAAEPPAEKKSLAQTVADPEVAERARQIRDAALAELQAKQNPVTPGPVASDGAPAPAPVRPPAALGKTMLHGGIAEPPPDAAPPPAAVAALGAVGSDKRTMVGMPAVGLPAPAPASPAPHAIPPAFKTMLGVAIPGIAPTHEQPPPEPVAPPARAGTLLGIAAPGIAPSRPGDHAAAPSRSAPGEGARFAAAGAAERHRAPPRPPEAPPPPIVPAPAPLVLEPLPQAPTAPKRSGVPAVAVVAIVFVVVAIVGSAAAYFVLREGPPLSAQPQLDDSGKESLRIRCESCPDGTVITLGASSSTVEGATTILPLPAPLSIGENDLEMAIDRPAPGRDETVKVHVPVAYRVKADLSTAQTRDGASAAVTVRVEALAGTEVTINGEPVALDDAGKGAYALDVASEVEGPSVEQTAIDKKIPFTIKPKGRAAEDGQLVVRAGVAPLHLDAPGRQLFTERATAAVSGQVKPGTVVTVDGQSLTVDAQGRFNVGVALPAPGPKAITIAASAPPLATRVVRAELVRVPSLEDAAKTLDAKAPITFAAYGADPKSKMGALALVDGEIQDVRTLAGYTVMAVEEKKACGAAGACVVRVVHGDELKAARGDAVRVYGYVAGLATLNGAPIPQVEASLVLAKPAAKR